MLDRGIVSGSQIISYHPIHENFIDMTDNMNIWVWRQLAPSGDLLIKESATSIRRMQQKYDLL